jgi:hypothetical protein
MGTKTFLSKDAENKSYKCTFTLYFFLAVFDLFHFAKDIVYVSLKTPSLNRSLSYKKGEVRRKVGKGALGVRKDQGRLSKKDGQSFYSKRSKCY